MTKMPELSDEKIEEITLGLTGESSSLPLLNLRDVAEFVWGWLQEGDEQAKP